MKSSARYVDTLEGLHKMRAALATPRNWTKGAFAKTREGNYSFPGRDDAVQFCLLGACAHFKVPTDVVREHLPGGRHLINFNDREDTTHADIVAVLDRAIAAEEARRSQ